MAAAALLKGEGAPVLGVEAAADRARVRVEADHGLVPSSSLEVVLLITMGRCGVLTLYTLPRGGMVLLNWRVTVPPSRPVKVMSPWPLRTSGWMLTFVQDFRCFTRSLAQHGASLALVFSGMLKSLVEAWDSDQIKLNYLDRCVYYIIR